MWLRVRRTGHARENDGFRFVAIGLPSSFSVRVVDSRRGGGGGESTSSRYIPQRFHRTRRFRLQVDAVYEFVPISIQSPTHAVTPTPVHAVVFLPTVELSRMI